jgi:hypothetical protein
MGSALLWMYISCHHLLLPGLGSSCAVQGGSCSAVYSSKPDSGHKWLSMSMPQKSANCWQSCIAWHLSAQQRQLTRIPPCVKGRQSTYRHCTSTSPGGGTPVSSRKAGSLVEMPCCPHVEHLRMRTMRGRSGGASKPLRSVRPSS